MSSKILIYRIGQLGDTIAAIPAVAAVRRHFAGREVVLLSECAARVHLGPELILEPTGLVDSFATYPPANSAKGILGSLAKFRRLASSGVEALVYLVPSIRPRSKRMRDLLAFRLAGFFKIYGTKGFPNEIAPRGPNGILHSVQNETDALLGRLAADSIAVPRPGEASIDLNLQQCEQDVAKDWLDHHGLTKGSGRKWIAVCPGSKWASKLWPIENYAELGRRLLSEHGLVPMVVGGTEDQVVANELIAHWGGGGCAAGQLSVRESAALMEHATFYLGNDTGAMHLAAAVGTPCVAIFSAQDWPGRWDPYGSGHQILRTHIECAGCMSATCPNQVSCLRQITPQDAYEACMRVISYRD